MTRAVLMFVISMLTAFAVRAADPAPIRVAYCMEPGVCYNRPGQPRAGVVVDWMTRIGEFLGREIEWVDVTQAKAEEMLAKNEIDIIGGLIFRTERAKKFYYFPHVTGQWRISLYTRLSHGRRRRAERLRDGAVIGNVRSFPITDGIMDAMKRHGMSCTIREYDDVPQIENALREGEVDAMLADGISDGSDIACVACDLSVPQYLVTGAGRWDIIEDIERAMRHIVEDVNFVNDCRKRNYPLDHGEMLPTFEELLWLGERIDQRRPLLVDISASDRFEVGEGVKRGRVCGTIGGFLDRLEKFTGLTYRALPELSDDEIVACGGRPEADLWFPSEYESRITRETVESNGWRTVWATLPQASCVRRGSSASYFDGASRIAVWKKDLARIAYYRDNGMQDRVVTFDERQDCLRALADQRVDCIVGNFYAVRALVDEMALNDLVDANYAENIAIGHGTPFYVGPKTDPQLATMLERFVRSLKPNDFMNMRLKAEADSWVPTMPVSKVLVWFTSAAVIVLIGLLVLMLYVQRRLSLSYHAAQAANRAKSTFIATMSHEIRTPLNAVIGFAEFLRAGGGTLEERQGYVDGITRASNALLALINDILDISKLDAGQDSIVGGMTDFAKLAEEMKSVFRFKFDQKGVRFTVETPDGMPLVVLQELRMRQILFNLIGNAVKFTEKGEVRVAVGWKAAEGRLTITVADTGIGISPAAIKDIFNPFAQDGSVRGGKVYEGTGLGLAIVKRLVDSADGTISVTSEVGKGTTFTIEIPGVEEVVRPVAACRGGRDSTGANRTVAASATSAALEVFIVDDVKMNLTILKQHLKMAGVPVEHIHSYTSAPLALSVLSPQPPTSSLRPPILILTDMWMPEMDGSAFAAAIRRDAKLKDARIVAVTADADSGKSFDVSLFDAILVKPVTGEKIRKLLFG